MDTLDRLCVELAETSPRVDVKVLREYTREVSHVITSTGEEGGLVAEKRTLKVLQVKTLRALNPKPLKPRRVHSREKPPFYILKYFGIRIQISILNTNRVSMAYD